MRFCTLIDGKATVRETVPVFNGETDVCVVGMGTAGAMATICAGEQGLSVIGIDRNNVMGGVATASTVWDYYFGTYGGRREDINRDCFAMVRRGYGQIGPNVECPHNRNQSICGAVKSYVLEQYAEKAGCRLFYNATVTGVYMEGSRAVGVQFFDGETLRNYRTRCLIDCADGMVCRLCGCEMLRGRDSDHNTLRFSKPYAVCSGGYIHGAWGTKFFPDADVREFTNRVLLTAVEQPGLRDHYGAENRIIYEGSMMGRRGVWGVVTEDVYTFADYVARKKPVKPVVYACTPYDNSNPDIYRENEMTQNWGLLCNMHIYNYTVGIPMGALLPRGIDGVVIAGKAIGLGHDMMGGVRMKSEMEKLGETAAVIAALSIQDNVATKDVDYEKLIGILGKDGCYAPQTDIGLNNAREPDDDNKLWHPVPLPATPEEYETILSSDYPAVGLWGILYEAKDSMKPYLKKWLSSDNNSLRENSAVALGLLKDDACVPVLREILAGERKPVTVNHGPHKFGWYCTTTYCNFDKAVVLLGRFRDKASLPRLTEIAESENPIANFAREAIRVIQASEAN